MQTNIAEAARLESPLSEEDAHVPEAGPEAGDRAGCHADWGPVAMRLTVS